MRLCITSTDTVNIVTPTVAPYILRSEAAPVFESSQVLVDKIEFFGDDMAIDTREREFGLGGDMIVSNIAVETRIAHSVPEAFRCADNGGAVTAQGT